ncbi:MAG: sporulation protein YqfD [Bacillota bacterium]|nr:sporulation protein YqfD [Bacillota bacterium]
MFIIHIVRLFLGYVNLTVRGLFTERFLNMCMKSGVSVWNIKKNSTDELTLSTLRKNVKDINKIAAASGNTASVVKTRGLPFMVKKYKKRYALALGMVVCAVLIFTTSSFVWSIEVSGNEKVESSAILNSLQKYGFKKGILKSSIQHDFLTQSVLLDMPELSWLSLNVKGTKVEVEVKERVKAPDIVDKTTPRNIVAKETGQIISIEAYEGQSVATVGAAVSKGDVLVSGQITNTEGKTRLVAARAKVLARTWYTFMNTCPKTIVEREKTGKVYSRNTLKIFDFPIKLFIKSGIPVTNYDKIETKKELSVGHDFYLPITLYKESFEEVREVERQLTPDEQRQLCLDSLNKAKNEHLKDVNIESENVKERDDNGSLIMTLECQCIENIAEDAPITQTEVPEDIPKTQG